MNTKSFMKISVAVLISVILFTSPAKAQNQQLQEKLSKEISIRLSDVTIGNALENIGQKAGVKIVLSEEAVWKLPYGEATRLSVSLSGPLADSLTEMLNAFFMRYAVGEEEITIYPRPEMEHILGRPSAKQLELLKAIYTKTINVYHLDQVQKTINGALDEQILISPINMQFQLNSLLRQLVGKEKVGTETVLYNGRPVEVEKKYEIESIESEPKEYILPTPVTLVQLLNQVAVTGFGPENTRWYISGMDFQGQTPEVHVVNSNEFHTLRLKQKIDVSYSDQALDKIFQDLANRAGVSLIVGTGSQLHEYSLSASMQNIEIKQAIRNIAEMAGVECEVRTDYIMLSLRNRNPAPAKSKNENKDSGKIITEGYVGKISIPMEDGKYFIEFMLRESDLTDELKKIRAEKMKQVLGEH